MAREKKKEETSVPPPAGSRELRDSLRLPRIVIAVRARVSEPSVKMYEANPLFVTLPIRSKLDTVYRELAEELASRAA